MAVLIDPPTWPAHGTLWSHLVSDSSLYELRSFARAQDVPDRGLDHDHYDVPADRFESLVAAGAVPLDGRQVARSLEASGLRVPGHERRRATRSVLLVRWARLWHADDRATHAVGEDLVDRWREPHRVYHSRLHLADALDALDALLPPSDSSAREAWLARVALWFHDAVHDGEARRDEERSAALALALLGPLVGDARTAVAGEPVLTAHDVEEVARLVLVTADHAPSDDDRPGALVSDADLAVLGADAARYDRYTQQVRAEYAQVPDDAFRSGRAAVLAELLDLASGPGLFRTSAGARRWSAQSMANLHRERDLLTMPRYL